MSRILTDFHTAKASISKANQNRPGTQRTRGFNLRNPSVLHGFHFQMFKIRDNPRESVAALKVFIFESSKSVKISGDPWLPWLSEISTGLQIPILGLYFGCASKRLEGSPP